eukprot:459432_1
MLRGSWLVLLRITARTLYSTQRKACGGEGGMMYPSAMMKDGPSEGAARAMLTSNTAESIREAGARLRNGGLVAFPTETVYGLGANALQETAVRSVFLAKKRPLTDPLIVHVLNLPSALEVMKFDKEGVEGLEFRKVVTRIGEAFWPGPLTVIGPAAECVPSVVTARTGWVGVRCPSHPTARKLLESAGVPVCAPSANRFGHVSPTTAKHVLHDLAFEDVVVIQDEATDDDDNLCCSIGIESTVVKEAPGQLIRHYAPDVETFMLPLSDLATTLSSSSSYIPPPGTAIVDCGAFLAYLRERQEIVGYTDLSPFRSAREAASTLFQKLRWAESIPGVKRIVIVQCIPDKSCEGMAEAINDRIFRAACGRIATTSAMHY